MVGESLRRLHEHHVGVRPLDLKTGRAQSLRQQLGVGVVLGEPADVVLERIQPGRGDHAGLAHRAAEDFPVSKGFLHEVRTAEEKRPRRRAQAFRQADGNRIEALAEFLRRHTQLRRRVEDARAIEMRGQLPALCQLQCCVEILPRNRLAADGIFQREQPRAREVRIVGLDRRLERREIERAVGLVGDRLRLDRAQHRAAARLEAVGVRVLADQVFVAAPAMAHQRRQVGLRARGKQQPPLEAEQPRGLRLQAVDRGIVAEHVVADLRLCHRAPHARRRARHRVGTQIDQRAGVVTDHDVSPPLMGANINPCAPRASR